MRPSRTAGILLGVALAASACAPKGTTGRGETPTPSGKRSPTPTPTPIDTKSTLVELGLGGPRTFWNDPPIRPGEKLVWVVTSPDFPDRILEVARIADETVPDHWKLTGGHPSAQRRTVEVLRDGGAGPGAARLTMSLPADVAAENAAMQQILVSRSAIAGSGGDVSFAASGGTFLGNEVLRVPAGEFRARHAVIASPGRNWHLYLVRTVPGGIAKVEMIPDGATDPTVVYELDDFTRLPRTEPAP